MKDAYWFHHDSNAKDDPKCSMLIEQLGLEGYGIYWVLVETLREQTEYKYPLSMIPIIARKYNTTAEKVRVVVGNYGLFTLTGDEFFLSESLCRRMESWDLKRLSASNAGKVSAQKRLLLKASPTVVERTLNDGSTNKRREEKKRDINMSPLEQSFEDFKEMRKKIKKPMTDRAETTIRKKLDQLASTDDEKIAILEQSIVSCWLSVFPLRQQFNQQSQQAELGKDFWRGAL